MYYVDDVLIKTEIERSNGAQLAKQARQTKYRTNLWITINMWVQSLFKLCHYSKNSKLLMQIEIVYKPKVYTY